MSWILWLAVIPVLGVLIFVHELGHFLAAKAVGIGVPRFSIGLGPITPLRFQRGETEYVISWVPFGGYVKMASQEELDELEALEGGQIDGDVFPPDKLFENKSLAARILVISAGVIMNALFAWGAYSWLAYQNGRAEDPTTRIGAVDERLLPDVARPLLDLPSGAEIVRVNGEDVGSWDDILAAVETPGIDELRFETAGGAAPIVIDVSSLDLETQFQIGSALQPYWEARVGGLAPGQPAAEAGLEAGDLVTSIDGTEIRYWGEMVEIVEASIGKPLLFSIDRKGEMLEFSLTPAEVSIPDPLADEPRKAGRVGIGPQIDWIRTRYSFSEAVIEGGRRSIEMGGMVLYFLKGLFLGRESINQVGGPIMIAQVSAQAAALGFDFLLGLTALLSINLAILNLLPIPVLDGGHLVFLFLEGLRGGRPVSKPLRQRLTMVGFYFLLAFMLFVIVNDSLRLI